MEYFGDAVFISSVHLQVFSSVGFLGGHSDKVSRVRTYSKHQLIVSLYV